MSTTALGIHYPTSASAVNPPSDMQTLAGDVDALVTADRARLTAIENRVTRHRRATNSPNLTSTPVNVCYVSRNVVSGHLYMVVASSITAYAAATDHYLQGDMRYTLGASASVPDPVSGSIVEGSTWGTEIKNSGGAPELVNAIGFYTATASQVLTVSLTAKRGSGASTSYLILSGSAGNSLNLVITDLGVDPGSTGTNV